MTQTLFQREFGADVATLLDSTLFIGDSPNDEPMFAYFPISVGVANIQSQLHACNAGRPMWPPAMACGLRRDGRTAAGRPRLTPWKRRGDHTENHLNPRPRPLPPRPTWPPQHPVHRGRRAAAGRAGGRRQPLTLRDPPARRRPRPRRTPIWSASSAWAWCSRTAPPASTSWDRSPCRWGWSACSGWTRCASPCPRSPSCNPRSATGHRRAGSHGPTMIHMTEASYPVHVNMRKGHVVHAAHRHRAGVRRLAAAQGQRALHRPRRGRHRRHRQPDAAAQGLARQRRGAAGRHPRARHGARWAIRCPAWTRCRCRCSTAPATSRWR